MPREGTIVDLGCGYGIFAHLLALGSPARGVIGLDLDPVRIQVAQEAARGRNNVSFACVDLQDADLPLPSCRAITLIDLLHHVPFEAQEGLIVRCAQALQPGGLLLIKDISSSPRWKYLWNALHDRLMTRGKRIYCRPPQDFVETLERIGLDRVRPVPLKTWTPYPHILLLGYRR